MIAYGGRIFDPACEADLANPVSFLMTESFSVKVNKAEKIVRCNVIVRCKAAKRGIYD